MRKRSWTKDELITAAITSTSIREVLSKLGLREAGGNYSNIRNYIIQERIDISHFTGRGWSKGIKKEFSPLIPLENILIKGSTFQSFKLRNRLFKANLKNKKCEACGWVKYSSSGHLPLELHHKNGDSTDNRIENLQVLCPNCHSLTPNHRSRKR